MTMQLLPMAKGLTYPHCGPIQGQEYFPSLPLPFCSLTAPSIVAFAVARSLSLQRSAEHRTNARGRRLGTII